MMRSRFSILAALLLLPRLAAAQTYTIMPQPYGLVQNDSNATVANGCVWTYAAGTTTPIATYSNNTGTLNANPIIADANGRFTAYVLAGTNYKFVYENTPCSASGHGTVLRTADNILGTPGASATVDVTGTAGETLSAGNCAYLSDGSGSKNSGQWYKCDSANTYSSTTPSIGMALAAITAASSGSIRIAGAMTGLSSLSTGSTYYVSGTAGALTTTAPANSRRVGQADSATTLVLTGNPPPPLTLPVSVANGGTGLSSTPTNGQLLIGNGTNYTLAALTAGNGIAVTNGAGSISLASSQLLAACTTTTEQDVVNTTTETSVMSCTVPGGTLSTANGLRVTLTGSYLNNTGGGTNLYVSVKYGGTIIAGGPNGTGAAVGGGGYASSANRHAVILQSTISANGSTSSQRGDTIIWLGTTTATETDWATPDTVNTNLKSNLAIDSTTNQTLTVTVQHGSASANLSFKRFAVFVEVLR